MQDWRIHLVRSTRVALGIAAAMISTLAVLGLVADALQLFPVSLTAPALISAGVGVFTVSISWVLMHRAEASGYTRRLTYITFSLLAITVMLATLLFGGIASVLPYAYTPIILAVAILLGMRPALWMATWCVTLHGAAALLEIFNLYQPAQIWGALIPLADYPGVGFTVVLIAAVIFYLIAWVAGALSDLLAEQHHAIGANSELRRQETLKTEFLSTVAHELRTPLTSARGYLHLVNAGMIPPDKLPELLSRIQENVDTITDHINDLMFLQEVDLVIEQHDQVDLLSLTQEVLTSYQTRCMSQGVTLQLQSDKPLPIIRGDQKALSRVLMALIDNAVKYSPDGGTVQVQTGVEGGHIYLTVTDEGIGITSHDLPHIFERFYHVDKDADHIYGGMGVGLPIAQRLIRAHKGDIRATSVHGQGSTFTIWLPAK